MEAKNHIIIHAEIDEHSGFILITYQILEYTKKIGKVDPSRATKPK